jgi:hypothetical protein
MFQSCLHAASHHDNDATLAVQAPRVDIGTRSAKPRHSPIPSQNLAAVHGLFKAVALRGHAGNILGTGGTFVPRTITGNQSARSNHALGTAIDINPSQNTYGTSGAGRGASLAAVGGERERDRDGRDPRAGGPRRTTCGASLGRRWRQAREMDARGHHRRAGELDSDRHRARFVLCAAPWSARAGACRASCLRALRCCP